MFFSPWQDIHTHTHTPPMSLSVVVWRYSHRKTILVTRFHTSEWRHCVRVFCCFVSMPVTVWERRAPPTLSSTCHLPLEPPPKEEINGIGVKGRWELRKLKPNGANGHPLACPPTTARFQRTVVFGINVPHKSPGWCFWSAGARTVQKRIAHIPFGNVNK